MTLSITSLRPRTQLNFYYNIYTKDELKAIFIQNYNSKNGNSLSSSLNNNMSYQCYRNAAFYILSRMQLDIWNSIDKLPDFEYDAEGDGHFSSDDMNMYIVIQTFIELMDDNIINLAIPGSTTIEHKRTSFLDYRLDQTDIAKPLKYISFGILKREYKPDYLPDGRHGGTSDGVISFFVRKYFTDSKFAPVLDILPISNIDDSLSGSKNYVIVKLPIERIKLNTFIDNIDDLKTRTIGSDVYKLAGVLYDCDDHQISSICYGDACTSIPPNHNFHDDHSVINKNMIKGDFTRPGFSFGCSKPANISTTMLLYEKNTAVEELRTQVMEFAKKDATNLSGKANIHGGYYKAKYLKYKNKYLTLKNLQRY